MSSNCHPAVAISSHLEMRVLPYFVKGQDLSGSVSLRRDSADAALKKARELLAQDSLEVEITDPDGTVFREQDFDKLTARPLDLE